MTLTIKLRPWQTPNFVLAEMPPQPRQEGGIKPDDGPKWPLKEVDADTLAKMCDEFRAEIFRKAEKPDPALPLPTPASHADTLCDRCKAAGASIEPPGIYLCPKCKDDLAPKPDPKQRTEPYGGSNPCRKCGMPGAVLHVPGGFLCPGGCKTPYIGPL